MKINKKTVFAAAALLLAAISPVSVFAEETPLSIVTTIFPEYDWTRQILGDNSAGAELTMLLDAGVDLHSFQPSAEDILRISDCDIFIYVGGESDSWVKDALQEATNADMTVINLLDALGESAKVEEVVEGMQEEEHQHDHDHEGEEHEEEEHSESEEHDDADHSEDADHHEEDEDHHEEGPEYDEHVWLSLRNARTLTGTIAAALAEKDPANAQLYLDNQAAYAQKLDELDAAYTEAVSQSEFKTVLFGDRFPFRYLVDDYGLEYYAAFMGCSAETEASFETVIFLTEKLNELQLPCVLTIESGDGRIADTIIQSSADKDRAVLKMDSMQSVTSQDVEDGATYLSIMEQNLEVLKEALTSK